MNIIQRIDSYLNKARIYIKNPSEAPEGTQVQRGRKGGIYYEGIKRLTRGRPSKKLDSVSIRGDNYTLNSRVSINFRTPRGLRVHNIGNIIEMGKDYIVLQGDRKGSQPEKISIETIINIKGLKPKVTAEKRKKEAKLFPKYPKSNFRRVHIRCDWGSDTVISSLKNLPQDHVNLITGVYTTREIPFYLGRIKVEGFVTAAWNDKDNIWLYTKLPNKVLFTHEVGHSVYRDRMQYYGKKEEVRQIWRNTKDDLSSRKEFPTKYSRTDPEEYFCECYAYYICRGKWSREHMNKEMYAMFKDYLFDGREYA